MSLLEKEIVEKFQQLDKAAKERVLDILLQTPSKTFDYDQWWSEVDALQAQMRARLGEDAIIGAVDLLAELRS